MRANNNDANIILARIGSERPFEDSIDTLFVVISLAFLSCWEIYLLSYIMIRR